MKSKKSLLTTGALLTLVVVLLSNVGGGQQQPRGSMVLIGFKDGSGRQAAERHRDCVRSFGGDVHHSFHFIPLVSAKLPPNLIAKLKDRPEVAYIEDDIVMHAVQQQIPWGVDRIDAELVWAATTTGAGVDVAILDTGIDYDHPDLKGNIAGGINYTGWRWTDGNTNKFYWNDKNGHGSHCAGIVAAENNTIGVVGVAPGARLWAVKVLNDDGDGYVSDIIQGLEWCADNAKEIASMSFGGQYSESLEHACSAAYAAGVLLVSAAGNEGTSGVTYPAACDSVIAVSATDSSDALAGFSSVGPQVELAAPGVTIKSTYKNGMYAIGDGTSMSCAHVSGAAALVWANAELGLTSAAQIRLRLQQTAEGIGLVASQQGYGLVDAQAAATQGNVHDIAVTALTAPTSVVAGSIVTIGVTVENHGTFDETFDVVLNEHPDGFSDTKTMTIVKGASTTASFSWDTAAATAGEHSFTVTAGPVAEETDTTDNSRSTTVTVEQALINIAITAIEIPSSVFQSDIVDVGVTVENVGNQDVDSDINVTLTDDTDGGTISTETISNGLAAHTSTILTFVWDTSGASTGDHTLTAGHDFADDDPDDDSFSTIVTVESQPVGPTMHVGDIVLDADVWPLGSWATLCRVTATVLILDSSEAGVSGATVYGSWTGAYNRNVSGSTNSEGEAIFRTNWVIGGGTFTFTVHDVTNAGWTYDPTANLEVSDSITVP